MTDTVVTVRYTASIAQCLRAAIVDRGWSNTQAALLRLLGAQHPLPRRVPASARRTTEGSTVQRSTQGTTPTQEDPA